MSLAYERACWFLSVLKFLNLYTSRWILQSNNFKKLLTSITKKDFISFVTYTTFIPLPKTTCFECFLYGIG